MAAPQQHAAGLRPDESGPPPSRPSSDSVHRRPCPTPITATAPAALNLVMATAQITTPASHRPADGTTVIHRQRRAGRRCADQQQLHEHEVVVGEGLGKPDRRRRAGRRPTRAASAIRASRVTSTPAAVSHRTTASARNADEATTTTNRASRTRVTLHPNAAKSGPIDPGILRDRVLEPVGVRGGPPVRPLVGQIEASGDGRRDGHQTDGGGRRAEQTQGSRDRDPCR